MSNCYDKIEEYISAIINVFRMIKKKAEMNNDTRLMMISLVIYNYSTYMAKEYGVNLMNVEEGKSINLIPVFEYISKNNIELLDFSNIDINDIDITKKEDLERFVLSHIYYITQSKV
jgi:hypothetical protein